MLIPLRYETTFKFTGSTFLNESAPDFPHSEIAVPSEHRIPRTWMFLLKLEKFLRSHVHENGTDRRGGWHQNAPDVCTGSVWMVCDLSGSIETWSVSAVNSFHHIKMRNRDQWWMCWRSSSTHCLSRCVWSSPDIRLRWSLWTRSPERSHNIP